MRRSKKIAAIVKALTRFKNNSLFQQAYTVLTTMLNNAYSQLPTVTIDTTTEETVQSIGKSHSELFMLIVEHLKSLWSIVGIVTCLIETVALLLRGRLPEVVDNLKKIISVIIMLPVAVIFDIFTVAWKILVHIAKIADILGRYALSWMTRKNIKITLGVLVYAFKIGLRDKFFKPLVYLKKISIVLKSLQYTKLLNEPKNKNRSWKRVAGEWTVAIIRFFIDFYINTSIDQKVFMLGSLAACAIPGNPFVIPAIFMWMEFLEYCLCYYLLPTDGTHSDSTYPERDFCETVLVMHYCRECIDYLREFPILNEVAEGSYATYLFFGYVFFYANIAIKEALVVAAAQCELLLGALINIPVLGALIDIFDSLVRVVAPWVFGCNFQHIYIPPIEAQKINSPDYATSNYEPKPSSLESCIQQISNLFRR